MSHSERKRKNMYTIGKSCFEIPGAEVFEAYAKAGLGAMEISVVKPQYPDIDFNTLMKNSRASGVDVWSLHLPYYASEEYGEIDTASLDSKIRKHTIDYYVPVIEKAASFGIDKFVVHPSREPISPESREERIKCAQETLDVLAEKAHSAGAVIAVEDLPRTCLGNCSGELLDIISVNSKLKVCFDTNHLLFEDNAEFIRKVGDKIITLHVSDCDFENERHWLPGEGKADWKSIIKALGEVGYSGVWMYEIGLQTPPTITRPRDLTLSDLVINAREIFEGKEISKII